MLLFSFSLWVVIRFVQSRKQMWSRNESSWRKYNKLLRHVWYSVVSLRLLKIACAHVSYFSRAQHTHRYTHIYIYTRLSPWSSSYVYSKYSLASSLSRAQTRRACADSRSTIKMQRFDSLARESRRCKCNPSAEFVSSWWGFQSLFILFMDYRRPLRKNMPRLIIFGIFERTT